VDLLYALQVPSKERILSPQVTYKVAVVPLLHAAASAGRVDRVLELLGAASSDAHLLEKRDAKGQTPLIAAAAAGEAGALAALLAEWRSTLELIATEGIQENWSGVVPLTAFGAACNAADAEGAAAHKFMGRFLLSNVGKKQEPFTKMISDFFKAAISQRAKELLSARAYLLQAEPSTLASRQGRVVQWRSLPQPQNVLLSSAAHGLRSSLGPCTLLEYGRQSVRLFF
jgi:hypothetical protein